jgi:hypothetical protein
MQPNPISGFKNQLATSLVSLCGILLRSSLNFESCFLMNLLHKVLCLRKSTFAFRIFLLNRPHVFLGQNGPFGAFWGKTHQNFSPFCLLSPQNLFSEKHVSGLNFFTKPHDGNQNGPSLKDPLQVPDGPITRSRAKKIKEAMQGLVQSTWDEASKSPTIKVGLKEGEPILIHLKQDVEDMT